MTVAGEHPTLSLAELDAHDPHPSVTGARRRYCCPLDACRDKTITRAHQSLSVDTESGAWQCFRCHATGKVTERWTDRPFRPARERRRAAALRSIRIPAERPPAPAASAPALPGLLARLVPLGATPGHPYLFRRGIGLGPADRAGARWVRDCYGRPGVVFPLIDQAGAIVAVNVRYVDDRQPKTRTVGDRHLGLFAPEPAVLADGAAPLVVTEGPFDALALVECDVPAVALIGTRAPRWLRTAAAFRTVYVALDADAEGDRASAELIDELAPFARRAERLRPPPWPRADQPDELGKDWADALLSDYVGLCELLEARLAPPPRSGT